MGLRANWAENGEDAASERQHQFKIHKSHIASIEVKVGCVARNGVVAISFLEDDLLALISLIERKHLTVAGGSPGDTGGTRRVSTCKLQ